MQVGIRAGFAMYEFAQREPADARLLAALRREDIVETVADAKLVAQLAEINEPLRAGRPRCAPALRTSDAGQRRVDHLCGS